MEQLLANRVRLIAESETIKMSKLARELAEEGKKIVNLSLGEPDFNTPEYVKKAAVQALNSNFTHYSPVAGYPELRMAICKKLEEENNLLYSPEQIVVSTGAKQALMNAILCVVNPGDEVLLPTPFWGSYAEMVRLAGGVPIYLRTEAENGFKLDKVTLLKAINSRTKLFMFSSPNNPTGNFYNKNELSILVEVFEQHPHVFILSDEIYEHLNYRGKHESIAQFKSIHQRVIVVNGFSKAYAMTGWRLGYLAAHKEIAKAAEKIQGQITSGTNSITQKAGFAAYNAHRESIDDMVKAFRKRRDIGFDILSSIPYVTLQKPDAAFYFFPDISYYFGKTTVEGGIISDSNDLVMYVLKKAGVALVAGDSFGNPDHIRISYAANEEDIISGLNGLKQVLSTLR